MENQILVKAAMKLGAYMPAAPSATQTLVEIGTMGVLSGLETRDSCLIAWVRWDPFGSYPARPYVADHVEVVGIRVGKRSFVVQ